MKTVRAQPVISLAKSTIVKSLAPFRTITSHSAPENRLRCAMEASTASDPSAFLSEIIGVPVTVKLNSGVVYKGMRASEAIWLPTYSNCRRTPICGRIHEHRP
jgi:hypothetical protein